MSTVFQKQVWLEYHKNTADENRKYFVSGIRCFDLEVLSDEVIMSDLAHLNEYYESNPLRVFPNATRRCLLEELYFGRKDEDFPHKIGGFLLSGLDAAEIAEMDGIKKMEILKSIGSVSPVSLLPLISLEKAEKLADLAADSDLSGDEIGSLIYYQNSSLRSSEVEDILQRKGYFKTACMAGKGREAIRSMLVKHYGAVDTWKHETFQRLGDLLVVLTEDDWNTRVEPEAFVRAAEKIARESKFHEHYESELDFTEEIKLGHVCSEWLGDEEGPGFAEALTRFARNTLLAAQDFHTSSRSFRRKRRSLSGELGNEWNDFFRSFRLLMTAAAGTRNRRQTSDAGDLSSQIFKLFTDWRQEGRIANATYKKLIHEMNTKLDAATIKAQNLLGAQFRGTPRQRILQISRFIGNATASISLDERNAVSK